MIELLSQGFLLGLLGSLHCVGMCGPLVLALPKSNNLWLGSLLENFGRALTYTLLGAGMGAIGSTFSIIGLQKSITLGMGFLILISLCLSSSFKLKFLNAIGWQKYTRFIHRLWKPFFVKRTYTSLLTLGLIHGLLPCGLVYVALARSTISSSPTQGAIFMFAFSLGTIPSLLFTTVFGKKLFNQLPFQPKLILKIGLLCVASLFILRGLSLGIPYISPNLQSSQSCH